jgi:hypothetical protein
MNAKLITTTKKSLLFASLLLSVSLQAQVVVDYDFADNYITNFTALGGSGSGATVADFGGDAQTDYIRHHTFSNPTTGDYLTTDNGTAAGPAFSISTATANIRQTGGAFPAAPSSNSYFETAVTGGDAIRIRPFTDDASASANMSTATWLTFSNTAWDALGAANAGFDASSYFQINGGNVGNQSFRFLVVSNGNYYVTDASDSSGSLNFGVTNLNTASFYSYSNATDGSTILFDQAAESSVVGSVLDNITAVGFYSELVDFDGTAITGNAGLAFDMTNFSANLAAVPEPSTYALLAGFATLGLVLFRRRLTK